MGSFKLVPNYFRCLTCVHSLLSAQIPSGLCSCPSSDMSFVFLKAMWKQMPVSTVETPTLMPRVLSLHHHRFPPLRCQNRLAQCNGRNAFHFGVQFSFGSCTCLATHKLFSISFTGFFQPPDDEILDLFSRTQFLTSALAAIIFWVTLVHFITNASQHSISPAIIPP